MTFTCPSCQGVGTETRAKVLDGCRVIKLPFIQVACRLCGGVGKVDLGVGGLQFEKILLYL